MRRAVIILVLVGGFFGVAESACPVFPGNQCQLSQLSCCDLQFQATLGLTNCTGAFFDEPYCHQRQLEAAYGTGVSGAMKICSAFTAYYQCLGGSIASCTSIEFHVRNNMDVPSALTLASIYKQFGFACGAGLDTYLNNAVCMAGVFTNSSAQIQSCRDTFSNNLQNSWMERCQYYNEYDGCFQSQFNSCGSEPGWFGCEYARQGGRVWLHDCYEQCAVTSNL